MQRTWSAVRLSAVTATAPPPLVGKGTRPIAIDFPSRFLPALAVQAIVTTFAVSVYLSWKHDVKTILKLPYVSDLANTQPAAGFMALGLVLTSVLIFCVAILNYGKIKNNLALVGANTGYKRNIFCTLCGLLGAPALGAAGCFDAARMPRTHLTFVCVFFISSSVFVVLVTNLYLKLLNFETATRHPTKELIRLQTSRWISLPLSVRCKVILSCVYTIFTILYLPIGLYMVSDVNDYSKDTENHQYRVSDATRTLGVSLSLLVAFFQNQ